MPLFKKRDLLFDFIYESVSKFLNNFSLEVFKIIDSTNTHIKYSPYSNSDSMKICLSEEQTNGVGKNARPWFSPSCGNIYASLRFNIHKKINQCAPLGCVCAIAIADVLSTYSNNIYIKWPNDILIKDKKIGGILIEIISNKMNTTQIILGFGINVNMNCHKYKDNVIDQSWTSLKEEINTEIDRNQLIVDILHRLCIRMRDFEKNGLYELLKAYEIFDYFKNSHVIFNVNENLTNIRGIYKQITEDGGIVICVNGCKKKYYTLQKIRKISHL